MHSHSFRTLRYRLAAAAVLLLSGVSAQAACEIWRDEHLNSWRGNCRIRDLQVSQSFIAGLERAIVFKWPDLRIKKFKYFVSGTSIRVDADIENIGLGNAIAGQLQVDVTIANPLTGMQQSATQTFTVPVPALAANSSQRVNVATVSVPNTMQDWDLVVWGIVDPPTVAQPVRGSISESDETNNAKSDACRRYGSVNPDTSVAACD